jgi:kynureninase
VTHQSVDIVLQQDKHDSLAQHRDKYHIPKGMIYLDGNSLGPVCVGVAERVSQVINEQWQESLIGGWNQHSWIDMPERVANRLAPIVGAKQNTITLCDTLSLNVVKALSAALQLRPERRVVLSDSGNFPSDLYIAEGLARSLDKDYEIRIVEPEAVADAIDESIAAVMLTHVDYRTGRVHDMAKITRLTHAAGAISVWDLAHSAGALPLDLDHSGVDFAIGCTYKYLNGGPGAPGFIYARKDLIDSVWPLLCGWLGHEDPFAFSEDYQPAKGIRRMRVGTPPVLALSALDAALDVFDDIDMQAIRKKSMALGDLFIERVEEFAGDYGLSLASPRNAEGRGSQVSFHCTEGYAVMQALIADGVIGDFRAPNIMRFGFTPLYLSFADVAEAAQRLQRVLAERRWDKDIYKQRGLVT